MRNEGVIKPLLIAAFTCIVSASAFYAGTQARQTGKPLTLDLQEKCSKRANEAELSDERWKRIHGISDAAISTTFENHYNEKLNKCFLTQTSIGQGNLTIYLSDAYEQKQFGSFGSLTKPEYSVIDCHVILPTGEDKHCHTTDEFDDLIKVYME